MGSHENLKQPLINRHPESKKARRSRRRSLQYKCLISEMVQGWKINKETKAATRWENGVYSFYIYIKKEDENAQETHKKVTNVIEKSK